MYNLDLETFYSKRISDAIEIACSYVGDKNLERLIRSCRLKPYRVFVKTYKPHRLEFWWVDEFGNSLLLSDNKLSVRLSDKKIRACTTVSTDLFGLRSIVETMKISKSIVLIDDLLIFYGNDEYFRCFDKSSREKVSPLKIGIEKLQNILQSIDGRYKKTDDYILYRLPNEELEILVKKEYQNE